MRQKNIIFPYRGRYREGLILVFCFILFAFYGCKKADKFYAEQLGQPQISYTRYPYNSSYTVGDTMVITGRLQPKNNLQISIGGVLAAIVKESTVVGSANIGVNNLNDDENQVSILITAAMAGTAREVKITSGGYTTIATPVDVFTYGGPGSFNSSLIAVQASPNYLSGSYKFLNAVTGKGDVYYYASATQNLWKIAKDGTTTMLYDLSALGITNFLAGGVDPQTQHIYFSVQTTAGYALYELNLQNTALSILNQSTGLAAPYQGAINTIQMMVTAIYPDSKGNLYLGMGTGNKGGAPSFVPDAIARYSVADGNVKYIYKELIPGQTYPDMPGVRISGYQTYGIRLSPDEDLLYVIHQPTTLNAHGGVISIALYDLSAVIQVQDLQPSTNNNDPTQYSVISSFSGLRINLFNSAASDFGYMPMPGRRLQVLLYQNYQQAANYDFPKWVVLDFATQRTYAYALGKFLEGDSGQYLFTNTDQLLNYDEDGNLYMTSNGLASYLVKTQPQ